MARPRQGRMFYIKFHGERTVHAVPLGQQKRYIGEQSRKGKRVQWSTTDPSKYKTQITRSEFGGYEYKGKVYSTEEGVKQAIKGEISQSLVKKGWLSSPTVSGRQVTYQELAEAKGKAVERASTRWQQQKVRTPVTPGKAPYTYRGKAYQSAAQVQQAIKERTTERLRGEGKISPADYRISGEKVGKKEFERRKFEAYEKTPVAQAKVRKPSIIVTTPTKRSFWDIAGQMEQAGVIGLTPGARAGAKAISYGMEKADPYVQRGKEYWEKLHPKDKFIRTNLDRAYKEIEKRGEQLTSYKEKKGVVTAIALAYPSYVFGYGRGLAGFGQAITHPYETTRGLVSTAQDPVGAAKTEVGRFRRDFPQTLGEWSGFGAGVRGVVGLTRVARGARAKPTLRRPHVKSKVKPITEKRTRQWTELRKVKVKGAKGLDFPIQKEFYAPAVKRKLVYPETVGAEVKTTLKPKAYQVKERLLGKREDVTTRVMKRGEYFDVTTERVIKQRGLRTGTQREVIKVLEKPTDQRFARYEMYRRKYKGEGFKEVGKRYMTKAEYQRTLKPLKAGELVKEVVSKEVGGQARITKKQMVGTMGEVMKFDKPYQFDKYLKDEAIYGRLQKQYRTDISAYAKPAKRPLPFQKGFTEHFQRGIKPWEVRKMKGAARYQTDFMAKMETPYIEYGADITGQYPLGRIQSPGGKEALFLFGETGSALKYSKGRVQTMYMGGTPIRVPDPYAKVKRLTPRQEARRLIKEGKLLGVYDVKGLEGGKGKKLWGRATFTREGKDLKPLFIDLEKELSRARIRREIEFGRFYGESLIKHKEFPSIGQVKTSRKFVKELYPTRERVLAHELLHVHHPLKSEKWVRARHDLAAKEGFRYVPKPTKLARTPQYQLNLRTHGLRDIQTKVYKEGFGYITPEIVPVRYQPMHEAGRIFIERGPSIMKRGKPVKQLSLMEQAQSVIQARELQRMKMGVSFEARTPPTFREWGREYAGAFKMGKRGQAGLPQLERRQQVKVQVSPTPELDKSFWRTGQVGMGQIEQRALMKPQPRVFPKMKQQLISQQKTDLKQRQRALLQSRVDLKQRQQLEQRMKQQQKLEQQLRAELKTELKTEMKTKVKQKLKVQTKVKTKIKTKIKTPPPTTRFGLKPPPPPAKYPPFKPFYKKKPMPTKVGGYFPQPKKYTPTVSGLLGLAPKATKKTMGAKFLTGLEERGVEPGFKIKKQRRRLR